MAVKSPSATPTAIGSAVRQLYMHTLAAGSPKDDMTTVVRLIEGWAGLYEMTPDHNPLLGEDAETRGLFVAAGFSGHGLMMSPATGKVMSELIRLGRSETVDVSPLAPDRFARGAPYHDGALI